MAAKGNLKMERGAKETGKPAPF